MNLTEMLNLINEETSRPAIYEYVPKGKKDGTIYVCRMEAKDKGKTDGDKIIAWGTMDCKNKLYTLIYKDGKWY